MNNNLTGRLLIASPHLSDGNFLRSVIFMIRHDVEGAFGLTINRPTSRRFRDLVDSSSVDGKPREDDFIFRGGPVDGPLLALHDLAGVGEPCGPYDPSHEPTSQNNAMHGSKFTVLPSPSDAWGAMSIELGNPPAWITGDDDHLRILLRRSDARVRYVAHYAGWGPGQLDEELRVGGWLAGDADPDLIFGNADDVWEKAVKQCGQQVLSEIAPGVAFGDPSLN
ncbi:hypothetical protein Pla22_50960 [Rubripirellula amarantea]|uniref:Uncharacterized protein n=1 Tax=Rubripirellula amarantea TaxID=2527999 RepID=A0A5C5WDI7_9BACT|nr:YqgE/AlgH family protein [Rubripirellula amarantea]TWT48095.1 hypothetical protein Pla22_50960 [Rubripirellula amarantea]